MKLLYILFGLALFGGLVSAVTADISTPDDGMTYSLTTLAINATCTGDNDSYDYTLEDVTSIPITIDSGNAANDTVVSTTYNFYPDGDYDILMTCTNDTDTDDDAITITMDANGDRFYSEGVEWGITTTTPDVPINPIILTILGAGAALFALYPIYKMIG